MSNKVYASIIRAIRNGKLLEPFSTHDFKRACPGFGKGTYRAFLHKHSNKNPGGYTVLFRRVRPGRFKCIRPFKYGL